MTADQAMEYGLVDEILGEKKEDADGADADGAGADGAGADEADKS